uniref:Anti-Mullerian hormone N-terminal domain-containing protein n=1 Tax=Salmo trutta TaxID=8032 RepID=A0A673WQE8_SALTR
TDVTSQSPSPASSRTYAFLCELQEFLSAVQPPQTQSQLRVAPVPLYTLHSLPILSLGLSSSETVLAGLLNSSALTLELALQPALLEVLRQRLEEVVVQMRTEEVGRDERAVEAPGTVCGEGAAGQEGPGKGHLCRLHSLNVSLEKFRLAHLQLPGSLPLSPDQRAHLCVPINTEDLKVVELAQDGTKISIKPNMVAKEYGCHCFLHVVQ